MKIDNKIAKKIYEMWKSHINTAFFIGLTDKQGQRELGKAQGVVEAMELVYDCKIKIESVGLNTYDFSICVNNGNPVFRETYRYEY